MCLLSLAACELLGVGLLFCIHLYVPDVQYDFKLFRIFSECSFHEWTNEYVKQPVPEVL